MSFKPTATIASIGLILAATAANAAQVSTTTVIDGNDAAKNTQSTIKMNIAANNEVKAYTTIKTLPSSGNVTITGTVASLDKEDKTIILRDENGDTIDVHSSQALAVQKGDSVKVNGTVQSEMAGFGKEIVSADVALVTQTQ